MGDSGCCVTGRNRTGFWTVADALGVAWFRGPTDTIRPGRLAGVGSDMQRPLGYQLVNTLSSVLYSSAEMKLLTLSLEPSSACCINQPQPAIVLLSELKVEFL